MKAVRLLQDPGMSVERLDPRHDRRGFSCGVESLDNYLKHQASQDEKRNAATVCVLLEDRTGTIAGYFTLSSSAIYPGELPQDLAKKLPKYRLLPATLLGRLAIDSRYKGKGLGQALLVAALEKCVVGCRTIASVAVVVDALDDNAARFYEHSGFRPLGGEGRSLFLTMNTIHALLGDTT